MLAPYPFSTDADGIGAEDAPSSANLLAQLSDRIVGLHLATYDKERSSLSDGFSRAALEDVDHATALVVVTTETGLFLYHATQRTCLKSWQVLGENNRPVRFEYCAKFVGGVDAVVALIDGGNRIVKIDLALPSGAHKLEALKVVPLAAKCCYVVVEESLASVVVLVAHDLSVTLMDVSEEQNATVVVPAEVDNEGARACARVQFAELVRPDSSQPLWYLCLLLRWEGSRPDGDKQASSSKSEWWLRVVSLQQSNGMLSLLKVDDCCLDDKELVDLLTSGRGENSRSLVTAFVAFSAKTFALCLESGSLIQISLADEVPDRLSWTSVATPCSHLSAAASLAGSQQLLCYVDGNTNKARCFDVKFGLDRTSEVEQLEDTIKKPMINGTHKPKASGATFVQSIVETKGVASVAVALPDNKILMYRCRLEGNSLAANLGKLRKDFPNVHLIVDEKMLSSAKPERWAAFVRQKRKNEETKIDDLEASAGDARHFSDLLRQTLKEKAPISMSFTRRAVKLSLEKKLWAGLQLLIKGNCVPSTSNQDIFSTVMAAHEVDLLYSAVCNLTDIPEASLVNILAYVLTDGDHERLAQFAARTDAKLELEHKKRKKRKRDDADESPEKEPSFNLQKFFERSMKGMTDAERGIVYLISAAMCVPCNQRFIVSALSNLNAEAAQLLLNLASHLLFVYDTVPASFLKESEEEGDRASRNRVALFKNATVPLPSRARCISWCLYLFDGKLRELVRSGANE